MASSEIEGSAAPRWFVPMFGALQGVPAELVQLTDSDRAKLRGVSDADVVKLRRADGSRVFCLRSRFEAEWIEAPATPAGDPHARVRQAALAAIGALQSLVDNLPRVP